MADDFKLLKLRYSFGWFVNVLPWIIFESVMHLNYWNMEHDSYQVLELNIDDSINWDITLKIYDIWHSF